MEFSLSASKLSAFKKLPVAPIAAKRPVTDTRHGITRTDDYAWLRADNWQEVFKDHLRARPGDPRPSGSRKRLSGRGDGGHEGASEDAVRRNEGPHQGRRFLRSRARRAPGLRRALVTGGQQPKYFERMPRGGGDDRRSRSTAIKEAEGKAYFRISPAGHSPDHSAS
jgi:oligopeptidase B